MSAASLFGVGCWAVLIPVLWLLVKRRFEQVTGRTPSLRPELIAPRPRRRPGVKRALIVDGAGDGNGSILTALPVEEKEPDGPGRLAKPGGPAGRTP